MEREDNLDLGNWTPWMAMEEEELQLFQPSDRNDASGFSSILQQASDAAENTIPSLSDLEDDSIFQTFLDLNNNSYGDSENMASDGLSTPEPPHNDCTSILPNDPGAIQGSPTTDLEDPFTLKISFGVNPVFASARFVELLQTPDSSTSRSRCASTSEVPDKTIKKKPRKRLTSEVERKEKRKESNRRAAGKYRQKQRETEKYRQENHDRLMEEITKLRERNEFLERKLEFCTCHSRVCPSTEPH